MFPVIVPRTLFQYPLKSGWPSGVRGAGFDDFTSARDSSSCASALDEHGNVAKLNAVRVGAPPKFEPLAGTEFSMDADLVLLAMGFTGPVKGGLIEQLGVNPEQVTPSASFIEDLGADSLDTVELVMAFEEEFSVEVPDEDAEKLQTVGDVNKYIEDKTAK